MATSEGTALIIHEARKSLNQISMHAELIKILSQQPKNAEEIQQAATQIITACKSCSDVLQTLND